MQKLGNIFLITFIFCFSILGLFSAYHFVFSRSVPCENCIENYLNELSSLKGERVSDYINEKEKDINFIKNSWAAKEILKMNTTSSEEVAMTVIDEALNIAKKDVMNYLISSNNKTLLELKNDIQFKRFAVQKVGGKGHTSIIDGNSSVILFHKYPIFVGMNLLEDEEVDKSLKNLIKVGLEQGHVKGFYMWRDFDGLMKKKFLSVSKIPIKTPDGFELAMVSTGYVDDFCVVNGVTEEVRNNLFNFKEYFNYDNLIIISKAGNAIYMIDEKNYLGTNIKDWRFGPFLEAFNEVNKTKETVVFGPFLECQDNVLKIGAISPIFDKGEFLGYILLIQKTDTINNFLENFKGLKDTGDTYMTNNEKLLVSSPRFKDFDLLVQEIKTENMDYCIEHFEKLETGEDIHEDKEGIYEYINYYGDSVLGTHFLIPETGWCVMVEFSETELFKNKWENKYLHIIISVFALFLSFFFATKYYLNRNYKLISRTKKH